MRTCGTLVNNLILGTIWILLIFSAFYFSKDKEDRKKLFVNMILYFNPHLQVAVITLYWGLLTRWFAGREVPVPYRSILGWGTDIIAPTTYLKYAQRFLYCIGITSVGYAIMLAVGSSERFASIFPAILYGAGLIYFICYSRQSFRAFWQIIKQTFVPSRVPQFRDIFFSDIFTSLSKDLGDALLSICTMMTSWGWSKADKCGSSWVTIVISCIPFCIRAYQCLRLYTDFENNVEVPTRHWINALKQVAMVCIMIFAGLYKHVKKEAWDDSWSIAWVIMFGFYTISALIWDIGYDWGLCTSDNCLWNQPVQTNIFSGGRQAWYYIIISINIAFRISWGFRLSQGRFDNHFVTFGLSCVELTRRMIWIPLRLEAEQMSRNIAPNADQLQEAEAQGEELLQIPAH